MVNIGLLIIAAMVAVNIYKSQLKQIEKLRQEQESEKTKTNLLEDIESLEQKLQAYKEILTPKDTSTIMNTINTLAQESGLKILSFRPGNEHSYQEHTAVPFYLEVNSPDYHSLGRFISKIESFRDVYIVESMNIRQDPQTNALVVNMTLSTISIPG